MPATTLQQLKGLDCTGNSATCILRRAPAKQWYRPCNSRNRTEKGPTRLALGVLVVSCKLVASSSSTPSGSLEGSEPSTQEERRNNLQR